MQNDHVCFTIVRVGWYHAVIRQIVISLATLVGALVLLINAPVRVSAAANDGVEPGTFRLFKTQNIWTHLLLDTRNGRVW